MMAAGLANENPADLEKRIHPNTLRFYSLPENPTTETVSPQALVNARRLDVIARLIYAKAKLSGKGYEWGKYVYSNLMLSQTNNFEKGEFDPGRSTMDEYIAQFDALIESIAQNGYVPSQSIIPTCQNTIIDGAHRLAISLALGIEDICTVELSGSPQMITFQDMHKFGMDPDAIHDIAREYVHIKSGTRCAVLFPVSASAHEAATQTLAADFDIDFQISVPISFSGMLKLQTLLYGCHDWWSEKNAHEFTQKRLKGSHFITLVFFQETKEVRPVKEAMRKHHAMDNHALHTTDTHEETTRIADIFFNKNALFWLNNALGQVTPRFDALLSAYTDIVKKSGHENDICIDTGGVMALHELRDVNDLDYIAMGSVTLPKSEHDIALHEGEYEALGLGSEEIITNPKHHFICEDLKYVALDRVADLKKHRNTSKDLYDLSLIRYLKTKDNLVWQVVWGKIKYKIRYKIYLGYHRSFDFIVACLHKILSDDHFERLRAAYKKLKG